MSKTMGSSAAVTLTLLLLLQGVEASVSASSTAFLVPPPPLVPQSSVLVRSTTESANDGGAVVDEKEAVKVFGRLAEKYIMLDGSAGMCCYSACADCEFREPGGGYRMADQRSARPKWIPTYEERKFEALAKEHVAKWNTEIFTQGPAVSKEEFASAVASMTFAPPLGGPYLSASAADLDNDSVVLDRLFDVLAGDKEKLTRHRMSVQMKELSQGDEGLTWPKFIKALQSVQ